ncbi:MAG: hypothetical protein V9G16_06255 [Nitrosomonas sp.]
MPLETFRWFAMLRYEFVVLLMMTSFLLVKGLRIAMMYQGVNVEGLEAYVPVGFVTLIGELDSKISTGSRAADRSQLERNAIWLRHPVAIVEKHSVFIHPVALHQMRKTYSRPKITLPRRVNKWTVLTHDATRISIVSLQI